MYDKIAPYITSFSNEVLSRVCLFLSELRLVNHISAPSPLLLRGFSCIPLDFLVHQPHLGDYYLEINKRSFVHDKLSIWISHVPQLLKYPEGLKFFLSIISDRKRFPLLCKEDDFWKLLPDIWPSLSGHDTTPFLKELLNVLSSSDIERFVTMMSLLSEGQVQSITPYLLIRFEIFQCFL